MKLVDDKVDMPFNAKDATETENHAIQTRIRRLSCKLHDDVTPYYMSFILIGYYHYFFFNPIRLGLFNRSPGLLGLEGSEAQMPKIKVTISRLK